jgi:hypothetical protein
MKKPVIGALLALAWALSDCRPVSAVQHDVKAPAADLRSSTFYGDSIRCRGARALLPGVPPLPGTADHSAGSAHQWAADSFTPATGDGSDTAGILDDLMLIKVKILTW